jgi:glycine/sarcosine N-methyltransferase
VPERDPPLRTGPAAFDRLARAYDLLVDAEVRAERDADALIPLLGARPGWRIHDAACGTGHLLRALAARGLVVAGSDGSPAMVARAGAAGEVGEVSVLDLARPPRGLDGAFDAVLCLGNSLPCVGTLRDVRRAVRTCVRLARPGGRVLLHTQDLASRPPGVVRSGPVRSGVVGGRETILLRHARRTGSRVDLDITMLRRETEGWSETVVAVPLAVIPRDWLVETLAAEGAVAIETYGDLAGQAYRPGPSADLFALARNG